LSDVLMTALDGDNQLITPLSLTILAIMRLQQPEANL
jgi:hypothetical protein